MQNNIILKTLGIIVVILIVGAIGFGIYWSNAQNPKKCINFVESKYVPAFEIYDGVAYPTGSSEMEKIYKVHNKCMAIVQGNDTSMDKCKALTNLTESLGVIYQNAANDGSLQAKNDIKQFVADFKNTINTTTASTCTNEYAVLQEQLKAIEDSFNPQNKTQERTLNVNPQQVEQLKRQLELQYQKAQEHSQQRAQQLSQPQAQQ